MCHCSVNRNFLWHRQRLAGIRSWQVQECHGQCQRSPADSLWQVLPVSSPQEREADPSSHATHSWEAERNLKCLADAQPTCHNPKVILWGHLTEKSPTLTVHSFLLVKHFQQEKLSTDTYPGLRTFCKSHNNKLLKQLRFQKGQPVLTLLPLFAKSKFS